MWVQQDWRLDEQPKTFLPSTLSVLTNTRGANTRLRPSCPSATATQLENFGWAAVGQNHRHFSGTDAQRRSRRWLRQAVWEQEVARQVATYKRTSLSLRLVPSQLVRAAMSPSERLARPNAGHRAGRRSSEPPRVVARARAQSRCRPGIPSLARTQR